MLRALAGTGLPVPRAVALCEDPAVFGSPFFIMEFLDGRVINDPALPGIAPADRAAMYAAALDALAALHRVDYQAVGLADFGRPQGYLERQVARWTTQYRATQSGALPAMDALIAWLPRHVPPGDEAAIAHGDYRIGNLCFAPHAPAVIGILDWELATPGHPLLDLAYFLTAHAMPLDVLRQTGGSAELASVPGIPSIDEAIEHYCRAAGRERPANLRFFGALAFFRSAAIMQGIRHRIALGNAAGGAEAAQRAAAVPRLAELGWAMVEGSGC